MVRGDAEKHEIYVAGFSGHLFTARVAKRAKVMFLQASVCPTGGGEVLHQMHHGIGHMVMGRSAQHLPPRDQVTTPPSSPGQHLPPPPGTRSQHPPGQHLPPPGTRSQHPPGQHLPPPGTRSQHPPGQHLPPPWDQVTTPLPWKTPPCPPGQHLPPSLGLCTGGQYASYWNAFLLSQIFYNAMVPMAPLLSHVKCATVDWQGSKGASQRHWSIKKIATKSGRFNINFLGLPIEFLDELPFTKVGLRSIKCS